MHWLLRTPPQKIYRGLRDKVIPNIGNLRNSSLRRCRCCERPTIFLQFAPWDELIVCIRCRATLRYQMLAEYIRETHPHIASLDVLELDRSSPLKPLLGRARSYARSFFDSGVSPGSVASDGAQMQDVTKLTFEDESFDLIVSSEVLEHVPDLGAAFAETRRVLRPGGAHIFTVPPHEKTKRLAEVIDGKTHQIVCPPEFHGDNNGRGGILTYWHIGPDVADLVDIGDMKLQIVKGPEGRDKRIVWKASRPL